VVAAALVTGCSTAAARMLSHPSSLSSTAVNSDPSSPSAESAPNPTPSGPTLKAAILIQGETIGSAPAYFAVDNGRMPHARGVTHFSKSGVPLSYTVVTGDTEIAIAARFGLPSFEQLFQDNFVRRCPLANGDPSQLFVGDIVNLDPHTITTVGSEHGRACRSALLSVMPKQESAAQAYLTP
jgi:hypothetical protein